MIASYNFFVFPKKIFIAIATFDPWMFITQAARNFNCSHIDAKTTSLRTHVPSTITNCMKPPKRTFSSHGPEINIKEWAAKFDAFEAKSAAELAA